jgi:adenylate cyclase
MGREIERKFLVKGEGWREAATRRTRMRQGYLSDGMSRSIRIRLEGDRAAINIKSSRDGIQRLEFEYPVPVEDAVAMLDHVALKPLIEKTRYEVPVGEHLWEVDVFEGDNSGLIVAEVELGAVDEVFERPEWAGEEVSHDHRYYNVSLREKPYKSWKE